MKAQRIRKAVIPSAGLGTRLLSATKEQPKEMLPVFARDQDGNLCLKPIVERIFEQLSDFGIREFCFVVGKGKRAIEDHFTPDHELTRRLKARGMEDRALQLETFYRRVDDSTIIWVNQPEPRGFGHAVLQTASVIGDETFIVHAGDAFIKAGAKTVPTRLDEVHARGGYDVTLTVKEVKDARHYGVVQTFETRAHSIIVKSVVEKPTEPISNLAIMPMYVFSPNIFEALRHTGPGKDNELQLTDAIQKLIESGGEVQAIKLSKEDIRVDVGTPDTYWEALDFTYHDSENKYSRPG